LSLQPQQAQGIAIPEQQIYFFPEHLAIPAQSAVTAYIVIDMKFAEDLEASYWTEIYIGGAEPHRLAIQLTIDPNKPDAPNDTDNLLEDGNY
jgi:hypothetical protein